MFERSKKLFHAAKDRVASVIDNSTGQIVGLVGTGVAVVSSPAQAVPPTTIAELTTAINFVDVGLGILAVAGALASVYVLWKGATIVVRAIRGM